MSGETYVGEVREIGYWYVTEEQQGKARKLINIMFASESNEYGVNYSPVCFYTATERLPELPQPDAKMLVGEARVLSFTDTSIDTNFLMDLQPSEITLLRALTQKAYLGNHPGSQPLPASNLDQLIASTGPDVARKLLQAH